MKIELFDTTLRDGTQGEHVTLTVDDKIRIARRLDDFGIDVIEGGWPGSNPKDKEFFERARDIEWKHAQICAFGSTRRAGLAPEDDPNLRALLEAETPTVAIFGKSWTLHARVALGVSLEENLELIASSVAYLKAHGRRVIYDAEHFFDGYQDDPAYALETLRAAAEAGADVLVLCDTNGGTLPSDIYRIVGRCDASSTCRWASTRTTTPVAPWPTRSWPWRPAPGTCRARSTASGNAAGMRICVWSSRTCSSRWASHACPKKSWPS